MALDARELQAVSKLLEQVNEAQNSLCAYVGHLKSLIGEVQFVDAENPEDDPIMDERRAGMHKDAETDSAALRDGAIARIKAEGLKISELRL